MNVSEDKQTFYIDQPDGVPEAICESRKQPRRAVKSQPEEERLTWAKPMAPRAQFAEAATRSSWQDRRVESLEFDASI